MTRYFAFLRAINVGGHTVKMETLRRLFESFGFSNVETFIASGNVIFETPAGDIHALERQIESGLHEALGYEVVTFIRTGPELAHIVSYTPFPRVDPAAREQVHIIFLPEALEAEVERKVLALNTASDEFHVHGREIYWLRRRNLSTQDFSTVNLSKAVGRPFTVRGVPTVVKLAAKWGPAAS